jgi:starch-binding outer membrane protein, SusD/RagB family
MAPGATMSAVQAINLVRSRIGQADMQPQFTAGKEIFRERIKNERNVEMAYEGHYYFDIRRWMDAPKAYAGPIMGVQIEKVETSDEYPTGYKYTRYQLEALRQSLWKDAMYYLPFNPEDNFKMKNFVPNEVW